VLETKHGTIINFLDAFEEALLPHLSHRVNHECAKRNMRDWDHNRRPGDRGITRDMDFSEDGAVKNADELQGEHWGSKSCTLFTSTWSWLSTDHWNRQSWKSYPLKPGDHVTVDGELASEPINTGSFYAVVRSRDEKAEGHWCDAPGSDAPIFRARSKLRHRVT